jgi:hypothetical protein
MNCNICDAKQTTADLRMRDYLRGICLLCAEEGGFHGMTLEETTRCVAMLRIVRAEQKMTSFERQLRKDQES